MPERATKENIVLIGLMGSGKSTVGRRLADWLGLHLCDIDAQIEYENECTIADIFKNQGEPFFRNLEKQVIAEACKIRPSVIATGGGAFVDSGNRRILNQHGATFYLRTTPETLAERVRHTRHRPLLGQEDALDRMKELLSMREIFYKEADYAIDTDGLNPDEVVREVLRLCNRDLPHLAVRSGDFW